MGKSTLRKSSPLSPYQEVVRKWIKPIEGSFKCICDAALFMAAGFIGYGCIIRDSTGTFFICMASEFVGVATIREAEAYGLRAALQWVLELGLSNVILN